MLKHKTRFESWLPALFDGQFQWDFLKPAWQAPTDKTPKGTKIEPMDYDMVVERAGHRLIGETKIKGRGVDLGSQITLTNEWKLGATILFIEGKDPENITGYALYKEGEHDPNIKIGDKQIKPADAFNVLYVARCWFCWANGSKIPNRRTWDNQLWQWDYATGGSDVRNYT